MLYLLRFFIMLMFYIDYSTNFERNICINL